MKGSSFQEGLPEITLQKIRDMALGEGRQKSKMVLCLCESERALASEERVWHSSKMIA
jgi:hypothetical protein